MLNKNSELIKTENGAMRLVILDSHGIIFRSYFALKDALTLKSTGEPVNAVYGFATSLITVVRDLAPTHIIAAWDASSDTFRKELDVNYKAHRDPTPPDLAPSPLAAPLLNMGQDGCWSGRDDGRVVY